MQNRRNFLRNSGIVLGVGAAALVGEQRGASAIPDDLDERLTLVKKAEEEPILRLDGLTSPVLIESVKLLKAGNEYIVHVRSKEGAEGIALTNSRAADLNPVFNRSVAPFFIGKDARDLEELLFGVYRYASNYKLQGLAFWCPVAWVEFAILDMLGRVANKSIGELLGGVVRREVPYYIASSRRDSTPEEEVEYLQKLLEETGARAVKYRVGGRMSRNADAMPGRTDKLIPLSRKVLGDKIDIHADSNSSYDPPQAVRVGRMLEEIGAVYFEEPCPFDHFEDTKCVADTLTIPVAGGEQEYSQRRFRWSIVNRGVDIVQPDLQYYGGLIRSSRVANMAHAVGMSTTVHISGGFGFIYMLHFASCTADVGKYQEYKSGIEKYYKWFDPSLRAQNGKMTVPTGPGVGIRDVAAVLKGAKEMR